MKEIHVTADYNDADLIDQISEITEEELERFMPLIEAIKAVSYKDGKWLHCPNWLTGECKREDEKGPKELYSHIDPELIEEFEEIYVPSSEYGIHTITEIKVYELPIKTKLL